MTHHHLAFKLLNCLKRNADDDDDGCAAQREVAHVGELTVEQRNERDNREEERADEGDSGKDLLDVLCGGSARTDARNGAVVGFEIVRHFDGVVLNGGVEISEHENKDEV